MPDTHSQFYLSEKPPAINGGYTEFRDSSPCSVSCGTGTIQRMRTCTNPAPQNGGQPCQGDSVITESCFISCTGKYTSGLFEQKEKLAQETEASISKAALDSRFILYKYYHSCSHNCSTINSAAKNNLAYFFLMNSLNKTWTPLANQMSFC